LRQSRGRRYTKDAPPALGLVGVERQAEPGCVRGKANSGSKQEGGADNGGRGRLVTGMARAPGRLRPPVLRIIASEEDVREGVRALRRRCQTMRMVHDAAGDPPLRRRPAGFEGLARIIVGQQLSVASASAIWLRTESLCQPFEPSALQQLQDVALAAAGLSRAKIRTLRAICAACTDGLDLMALDGRSDAEIQTALTAINGIGPWTADIYIMFCLGRGDAFAAGDLALQVGAQKALGLKARPSAAELLAIAERWRPWRGVAARLLWNYYAHLKRLGRATPV
jgi:DNA-3-methyladenine glycosylase II